ncbi:MetQ/NlpA family ABC transporter substrate-binding protein [Lactobacillus sp. ESL0731]|uniref:MetQ/NlpA family ABC transporter substrate-binding protein n=1 Tax=unclassified Lactobacillus TaxID=2620435 RepID=UPI0023F76A6B|nr:MULTISPECIES: MetQ/NlpA family ABC transporter substrate-binding protein [unclassified Lactobacillus]WEV50379.1 MetQ/NlpA family ABC transporter substrate-binding protein [Lactobacillus sp. ESL0700]WEV61509.1 MetQ/NlpA family ABC transporter substrate-binding protein [Lactobacillus sp. ESL0731]
MSNKKRRNIIIWIIIAVVVVVAAWFGLGPGLNKPKTQNHVVTVGVVSMTKADQDIWGHAATLAKKKYGVSIKIKNFTDFNQPNKALKNGDIDLDAFQHYAFLKDWNKANHGNIVAIARTQISPIRLYSKKYHKLSQLPDGATIAVPNDATNESRSLIVLKNAGLIKLRPHKSLLTVADIVKNPHNFKIKEVSADQCGRVVNSVDAAVVNNTFAAPAGLGEKQTIFVEPLNKDSLQWVNIICARKDEKDNQDYQAVVKAYQTAETKKLIKKYFKKTTIPAWDIKF